MDVWFHSDGHINDIFGDLIEIGVDVINCQVKVVGLDWVAANVARQGRVPHRHRPAARDAVRLAERR